MLLRSRTFSDALQVVEAIRERQCVLLQLDDASPEEAQRIVDVSAADGALHGQVQRVGECIFRATAGVMVSQI